MRPRRSASVKLARSYGPLVAVATAFVLLGALVAPAPRTTRALASDVTAGGLPPGLVGPGGATDPTAPGATVPGAVAAGPAGPGAIPPAVTRPAGSGLASGPKGQVRACPDRARQVSGDPYSPPCVLFDGDNGGATHRGVTATDITVSVRELDSPSAAQIFSQLSGQAVNDSPQAYHDTVDALAEYFSKKFDFYGRKLKIVYFKGQGNGSSELLGGGQEQAQADATKAGQEIKAFADISAITIPYADALSRQQVVGFGSPYPSSKWFEDRQPYAWSLFPDGTNVSSSAAAWINARIGRGTTADYAGAAYKGKPRVFGVIATENSEYQESVNVYLAKLKANGIVPVTNLKYKLDINSMPNQASNIVAQLKNAGVTSVICACDPVMLALGLTPKANEQDYQPEWITSGLAFVDQDIVSQLIDKGQWARAFGIAYNAESEPQGRSFPYAAYKQIRPNDEPAFGVEEIYYQMYLLAIGLQLAGPNLTPQTFQAGMYAYPGGQGPRGLWHFGPGDHTPTDDFREIWWDPNAISAQNNKSGAWIQLNGGKRFTAATVPQQPAPYFQRG